MAMERDGRTDGLRGAILQGNRARRISEWDRHTFLAMFAAVTIYLSADQTREAEGSSVISRIAGGVTRRV